MKRVRSLQYSIRGIPEEVDRLLRERAAQRKESLNQVVVNELVKATLGNVKKADFSDLVGKWTPDSEFDAALASQRRIDWKKWK